MSITHTYDDEHHSDNPLVGLVYLLTGILVFLLALRFLFTLLGINNSSGVVQLIYRWTEPLVRPFYGFLGTDLSYGNTRLELESILAIIAVAIFSAIVAFFLRLIFH